MSLTTAVVYWIVAGWIGAFLVWFDTKNMIFKRGWRLAFCCFAMILSGPISIVIGLIFILAMTIKRINNARAARTT